MSFQSAYDPGSDEFMDGEEEPVTEDFLLSPEGVMHKENNFKVGDPLLTGQVFHNDFLDSSMF